MIVVLAKLFDFHEEEVELCCLLLLFTKVRMKNIHGSISFVYEIKEYHMK